MLKTLRNAWSIPDLRKKMLFTIMMLVIYRLGSVIPVPGLSADAMAAFMSQDGGMGLFTLLDTFTGGAFSNATIFAMGITPYINASIIMQLLTVAIPALERLQKEGLSPLTREYIIDKINLRRVQKDCLISYAGNQYSVPAEYIGKDVAVVALDSMLAAYYEGKQIALHRISYQRKDMVVNPQHYRRLMLKQTMDAENVLLEQGKVIDFPLKPSDLSRYDEVLYE